jgi:HlyD family secretion protein
MALVPAAGLVHSWKPASPIDSLECVVVERTDLDTTLLAGGDLHPVKETVVKCEVEDITDTEGTTVLTVIENGAKVKKGDVLCRLDSSELDDMARQQEILVSQTRATCLSAKLVLETAQIALREYEQGLVVQITKEFESKIALARSDAQRQGDRLAWTEGMAGKGYLARSQLLTERQSLVRLRTEMAKIEGEFHVFSRYHVPKEIRALRKDIETAENNYRVQADTLKAAEAELAYLNKQIQNCTVRSPQDGMVVHASNGRWWPLPVQPGDRVYENQHLFLIPDLSKMEVEVSVHESMGPRVTLGMQANVRLASLPERVLSAKVASIEMLPSINWKSWDDNVKHFLTRVRLDETPASALPFMSAEVEFDTGQAREALVIPAESVAFTDRQACCFVVTNGHVEKRTITTRRATTELLEVTGGLNAGERVVARTADVDGIPIVDRTRDPAANGAPTSDQHASLAAEGVPMTASAG